MPEELNPIGRRTLRVHRPGPSRVRTSYLMAARALRTLADLCIDRRQRLQIFTLIALPSWNKVCLWTLALNLVLVWRLEWLTLFPLIPDFRQISHLMR